MQVEIKGQLVDTISGTAKWCKENKLGKIGERTLRRWCAEGVLRHNKVGNTTLINKKILLEFLDNPPSLPAEPKQAVVRRIG